MEDVAIVVSAPAWVDLVIFAVISPVIGGGEVVHAEFVHVCIWINVGFLNLAHAALGVRIEGWGIVATAPVSVVVVEVAIVAERVSR